MKKIIVLIMLCVAALGFGFGARESSSPALAGPSSVADRSVIEPQPEATLTPTADLGAADECGSELVTQDAATCSTLGWSFDGCCATHSRWRKGTTVKCCGVCMGTLADRDHRELR
jgi:hypothetical protein